MLTTIVGTQPIYFYFDVDEQSYLRYMEFVHDGKMKQDDGGAPVKIALPNSEKFDIAGRIDFADNSLDQQTGTLRLRATVPNENGFLTPGVFGRLRVELEPAIRRAAGAGRGDPVGPDPQDHHDGRARQQGRAEARRTRPAQ